MGVYQLRSGKWCYEIRGRKEGRQVTLDARYDFDTKDDATLAWIEAKQKVKIRTTHFLFRDAVAGRLEHLHLYTVKDEHEKVSKTYANNRVRLSRFGAWAYLPVEEITRQMIKSELEGLLGEGHTPANVNKHLMALKAVFNYAINEGKLAVNPTRGIDQFPAGERKVKFIPERNQFAEVPGPSPWTRLT